MKVSKNRSQSVSASADRTIEAAIPGLTGFSILDSLQRYLMKAFKEAGVTLRGTNSKKNSDGSVTHKLTFMYQPNQETDPVEVEFYVNGKPTDKSKEFVDLSFMYPDLKVDESGRKVKKEIDKYTDVPNKHKDILKKCQQMLNEVFQIDTIEDLPANLAATEDIMQSEKFLKFTLNKKKTDVIGSDYKMELRNIFANYAPSEVYTDINQIASDDDFLGQLDFEGPESYGVVITDDGYDVTTLASFNDASFTDGYKQAAYNAILDQAYKFYYDCKYVEYLACGRDMSKIIDYTLNYTWRLQEVIDTISKSIVATNLDLIHPLERFCNITTEATIKQESCFFWEGFCTYMTTNVQEFVNVLRLCSSNLPKEEELMIQSWIRSWLYELNYVLTRSNY